MTFAQKMRELRDSLGLSEARLAEMSGLAFGTLHDYGLGRRRPSLAAAVRIAKALGVDCTAFADCEDVTGEEPEAPAHKGVKDKAKPERRPSGGKAPRKGRGE